MTLAISVRWGSPPASEMPAIREAIRMAAIQETYQDTQQYAARQPPPALALAAPSPPPPALAAPSPPAPALAAPPPPSQQQPSALAAAARAALDACEMQDGRGSKRDALARTPPRPTAAPTPAPSAEPARKKMAHGGLGSAFAAAAPAAAAPQPLTATSYHPAALAAADPNRRFA